MKRRKRRSRRKKITILTKLCIIADILAICCFILFYGPWDGFRNLLINTALKTKDHRYLAEVFYSEEAIQKVKSSNYFVTIDDDSDTDSIIIDTREKEKYENVYDKQILTRDGNNDDYKIIDLKIGISNAKLIAIYEPTKVSLIRAKKFNSGAFGEQVTSMCKRYKGTICINAGGFKDPSGTGSDIPNGYVIDDGKIVWPLNKWDTQKGNLIGFNEEGILMLLSKTTGIEALEKGMKDAVEFGPFLIVNGKPLEIVGDPWGRSPRVAIAQRKDGVVLFLVIDGENYINGATLQEMVDVLLKYGAYNAANLDGGHSASLSINGKLANNPPSVAKKQGGRYVVTGFGLIP